MIAAIARAGADVVAVPVGPVPAAERAEVASGAPVVARPRPGVPLVVHTAPNLLPLACLALGRRHLRGRRVIGYWAWELPVAPPAWRHAGRLLHEVWAPSRFSAGALRALLPNTPVRVVPHPVAVRPPAPGPETRASFGLPTDAVVVLVSFSLASSFDRKNPLAAVAAFREAFGDRPDRILVLKVGRADHAPADVAALRGAVAGAANIRIETAFLPAGAAHALTALSDIVLSLHRSEGFGLVPAEAMLLGRAVVATDWSGTTDFLDASCAVPVPYRLVPAHDRRGVFVAPGARWAEADVGAAAVALRALADDPARRRALGAAARIRAAAAFGDAPLREALASNGVRLG